MSPAEDESDRIDLLKRMAGQYPGADLLAGTLEYLAATLSFPVDSVHRIAELIETSQEGSTRIVLPPLPPYYFPIASAEDLIEKVLYAQGQTLAYLNQTTPQAPTGPAMATGAIPLGTLPSGAPGRFAQADASTQPQTAAAAWGPAGYLLFTGLSAWELADFFIIPENGPPGYFPGNGYWMEVDGFWFRPVRGLWYKIPGLSWVEVYRTPSSISVRGWGVPPFWANPAQYVPTTWPPW